ncbi:pilus assembly protein TadG-related protein [Halomonas sp. Y3]|uniref:pilus assembly protein TadG-related protein n=1 Tax=Halomonas sp. Y3 TaxID=2956797 RepID=UPI00209E4526|nr:pilus assembly protein TadG-related protein [Halomonas sp. Y3]
MRLPRFDYPLPPRQRGVFGLMAAGLMLLMVISVALAVDTGRLFLEQRHMQRVADLAALEAAGAVTLISQASDADLASAAQDSAKRNGHDIGDSEESKRALSAVGGGVCRAPEDDGWARVFFAHALGEGTVECSTLDGSYSGTLERHAVEVTASHQVRPSLFGSLLGEDEITISATAMAQRSQAETVGVLEIRNTLASANLLSQLFGDDLGVTAIGYEGLADLSIGLLGLVDLAGGVGATDGLLKDVTLDVASLVSADLEGLVQGESSSLISTGLEVFQDTLEVMLDLGLGTIQLGDILAVDPEAPASSLDVSVNLLSLLDASVFLNDGNFINVEKLGLSLGQLGGVEVELGVIEPPQIAVGPVGCADGSFVDCKGDWKTEARTAQVRLGLGVDLRIPVIADLGVKLGLVAGGARAGIEGARPAGHEESHEWDVDVAAYQYPLATKLDLKLALLDSHLPWLDEDEPSSRVGEIIGFLQGTLGIVASIVNGLVDVLSTVVGGLLNFLIGGILGTGHEISEDGTEVCWKVLHIPAGCKATDTLKDDLETDGGETSGWDEDLGSWMEGFESETTGEAMSPGVHSLQWSSSMESLPFTGSVRNTVSGLSKNLQNDINLRVELFGVPLSVSDLLEPVLDIVDVVVMGVVANLAGTVVDPLLQALGVKVNEAVVRVEAIDHRTGPPELL